MKNKTQVQLSMLSQQVEPVEVTETARLFSLEIGA